MMKHCLIVAFSAILLYTTNFAQSHPEPSTMKNPVADIRPDDERAVEEAIVYLKLGNQKIADKEYLLAIDQFTKALEIKHDFKEALKNRGICYTIINKDEEAIKDFSHAITIDPEDASLYSYRGFAKAELKLYEAALKDLDKAISMNDKFSEAYMNKGIVYIWMKNYDAAIKEFDKIVVFDAENGKAYYNRGIAYEEKGEIARACLDWNKSLKLKYRLALNMIGSYCE